MSTRRVDDRPARRPVAGPALADLRSVRRVLAVAGCGVLTVTLSACESTEQESAKIGREAQSLTAPKGDLQLGRPNHSVHVADATVLSGGGRTAVAVRLTASSKQAQVGVPLIVSVSGTGGKQLYTNSTGELESSLQHIALLRPGQDAWWVDDQVNTTQHATAVKVRVGTGHTHSSAAAPRVVVSGVQVGAQAGLPTLNATLTNNSSQAQEKLPVFAVALKGGKVTAAGRAIIESLPAHAHKSFQIFLVGNPAGAALKLTVAPTVG